MAEDCRQEMLAAEAALNRAAHRLGLLVNLLEHEVAVAALVDAVTDNLRLLLLPSDLAVITVKYLYRGSRDVSSVALLEVDEPPCHGKERDLVRRDEVLADAEADDER